MKSTIEYPDFEKVDLRVGKVIEVHVPEWSNKLLEFRVDFGTEIGVKTIFSGIKKWYSPADFLEKNFVFVINLAERKMGEGISQGMMVMADTSDESGKPIIFELSAEIPAGSVIR